MFESFCAKYSHTFDRLPFGIFSVKMLVLFVLACSSLSYQNRFQYNRYLTGPKCNAEFGASFRHLSDKTVAMKTPMTVSDTGQSLHWELGQFYMCPTESA